MPQYKSKWLGSGKPNEPQVPELPPGIEVETWRVVSENPLIIEYWEKGKSPSAQPVSPPLRDPQLDLSDPNRFKGALDESHIDADIARDDEVIRILDSILREYVRRDDPRLYNLRTPTFHGPAHNWSGPDPAILSIQQVNGLSEWMASVAAGSGGMELLVDPIFRRLETVEHAISPEVFEQTDEFWADESNSYPLTRPPILERPFRVYVSGIRNSALSYRVEDDKLIFVGETPEHREGGGFHRDRIIVDYQSYQP